MGEPSIAAQVRELQQMTLAQLQERWREVFGRETKQRHRTYLWQRLAGELQSRHFGGPPSTTEAPLARSSRSRSRRANEGAPAAPRARQAGLRDSRLPPAGAVLTRRYKGHDIAVRVLDKGFEYRGRRYRSLSAVAREVTGTGWNGFLFFGLTEGGRR